MTYMCLSLSRVPSNCQRDFDLLAFDPDGDEVKCRYGSLSHAECDNCTPPSVTNLSQVSDHSLQRLSLSQTFSHKLSRNSDKSFPFAVVHSVIQLQRQQWPRPVRGPAGDGGFPPTDHHPESNQRRADDSNHQWRYQQNTNPVCLTG